jgi:hypothetical protein
VFKLGGGKEGGTWSDEEKRMGICEWRRKGMLKAF